MMVPYLHFTSGDFLYFKEWNPTSAGAIAGACIGLVLLALFERWLAATRSVFNAHWRKRCLPLASCGRFHRVLTVFLLSSRALALTTARDQIVTTRRVSPNSSPEMDKGSLLQDSVEQISRTPSTDSPSARKATIMKSRTRTIPPFIFAHDVPRGLLFGLQMLVSYLLMLAVMYASLWFLPCG